MKTISIKDDNGIVYEFEKPDFECELLKIARDESGIVIVGYRKKDTSVLPCAWDIHGTCYYHEEDCPGIMEEVKRFKLKPTKRERNNK